MLRKYYTLSCSGIRISVMNTNLRRWWLDRERWLNPDTEPIAGDKLQFSSLWTNNLVPISSGCGFYLTTYIGRTEIGKVTCRKDAWGFWAIGSSRLPTPQNGFFFGTLTGASDSKILPSRQWGSGNSEQAYTYFCPSCLKHWAARSCLFGVTTDAVWYSLCSWTKTARDSSH